jgi:HEXXH motif-containing protein
MTATHELPDLLFEGLAAGGGGPHAIAALRAAQLSKHMLLIGHILKRWPGPEPERDSIVDALAQARASNRDAFADVFGAPLVGAWSSITARAEQRGGASHADFAHLGALAVVACAAAGVDASAEVPVRDSLVSVPGLGAANVGPAPTACLEAIGGRLAISACGAVLDVPLDVPVTATEEVAWWQPVRHLEAAAAGQAVSLGLDDVDPYRHGHHAPPALRLSGDNVDRWRGRFDEAWHLLAEHLPERAAEIAAGLRTLVPLVQTDPGSARSATIRHAFGVFGLTLPPSADEFAVTLVHEFQHSKLSAMLDLQPMSDPDDHVLYFAPWRTDPRPLAGLLQGVYAFVGVADTWRALRTVDGIGPSAEAKFAEARLQVDRGLRSIESSDALTPTGVAVASRLRLVTDELLAEPVPADVARAAEQALARTREQWFERNGTADGVPD